MVEAVAKIEKQWVIKMWDLFKRAYCFSNFFHCAHWGVYLGLQSSVIFSLDKGPVAELLGK